MTPDESYYYGYARHLQWSYFDHPGMVGWIIRLSTLDLSISNEFTIRFFSFLLGFINLILVFKIGTLLKNQRAGLIAMLLSIGSPYMTAYAGVYIIPDVPMVFLWLLSIYFGVKYILENDNSSLIWFGVLSGLAILSKYNAVFLWLGLLIYLLKYNKAAFKSKYLYLSALCTAIFLLPILIWNVQNNFVSLTFHFSRINNSSEELINTVALSKGVWGMIMVQNPINIVLMIFILFKGWELVKKPTSFFLFWTAVPLILTMLIINIFNETLPHWNGPGWCSLIILASVLLTELSFLRIRKILWINTLLISSFSILFSVYVNTGTPKWLENVEELEESSFMNHDGWKQVNAILNDLIPEDSITIITHSWFPASYFEYNTLMNKQKDVFVFGDFKDRRNYHFSNDSTNTLKVNSDAYYITLSTKFRFPEISLLNKFDSFTIFDTIKIERKGERFYDLFVYKLTSAKQNLSIKTRMMPASSPIDNHLLWEVTESLNQIIFHSDFEYNNVYFLPRKVTKDLGYKSANSCKIGLDFRKKSIKITRSLLELKNQGITKLEGLSFMYFPTGKQQLQLSVIIKHDDKIVLKKPFELQTKTATYKEWNPLSLNVPVDLATYDSNSELELYLETIDDIPNWSYVDDMSLFFRK